MLPNWIKSSLEAVWKVGLGEKFAGYRLDVYMRPRTTDLWLVLNAIFYVVSAVSFPEHEGGKQVLQQMNDMAPSRIERLYLVWADSGYSGHPFSIWLLRRSCTGS
jgi:hypothetical protein